MTRQNVRPSSKDTPPEARKALAFVGIFTRVAAKTGVSTSHATKVARNERQSAKVMKAIVTEVRRIEREAERAA